MSPEQLAKGRYARISTVKKSPQTTGSTVAIVGLGSVGLPLALLAASRGFRVVGFDFDEVQVAQFSNRTADFLNEEDSTLFKHTPTLRITSDERELEQAETYIICVPVPVHENQAPDIHVLERACEVVGKHLKKGSLVVVESIVPPGACEGVVLPALEHASKLSREGFDFAYCPERVDKGDARWDVRITPRIIGAASARALERGVQLYTKLVDAEILPMRSIKEAEAVQLVENAFHDINTAFVNELAIAFGRAGIDIVNVIRGASTRPSGFMAFYPGCAPDGRGSSLDTQHLIQYGRENGFEHKFLIAARRINSRMPLYTVHVLEKAMRQRGKKLDGAIVTILGLTHARMFVGAPESSAGVIRDTLMHKGIAVRTFDPVGPGSTARGIESALRGADAVIVAADHPVFRALKPHDFESYGVDVVIDGCNCLDRDAFAVSDVLYRGIGRS